MNFDDGMPKKCPPDEAAYTPCVVFRATDGNPIQDSDLLSWVMLELPNAKKKNCKHWGLSIWLTSEAAEHARDIVPTLRDKYIAEGALLLGDGRYMATPTKNQPEHCTLWYNTAVDLKPRFSVIMEPDDE